MDGFCAGKVFYLKAVSKDLVSCLPVEPKLRVVGASGKIYKKRTGSRYLCSCLFAYQYNV